MRKGQKQMETKTVTYSLKMKNPVTGSIESYTSEIPEGCSEELALSVWVSAGYTILSFKPVFCAEAV